MEAATGYEAHAFPAGTPPSERPPLLVTLEPTFRADGLEPGSVMTIFVRAIRDTAGGRAFGPWSDPGTGTTLTSPSAPTLEARSMRDRPDEVHGLQIHPIYVIPSDGRDWEVDRDGRVARSLQITVDWLTERLGRRLRVDTFNGEPDVTFLQLDVTKSQVEDSPESTDHIWDAIRESRGSSENKIYAVYYSVEGGSDLYFAGFTLEGVAGLGARGPALVVMTDALELGNGLGWYEAVMAHELFHAMGAVQGCAPNHIVGKHVDDDPYDLMYAGDERRLGWDPEVNRAHAVDSGNDDYYGHRIPGCVDTEDSPLWIDPPGGLPAALRPQVRVLPSALRPIRCWRH
ncbi:MAG: hypothetical protein F4Y14_01305 [Acidobacteria bacterium]|nr:hypothetical protein [Acidobacteriota bacterium]